MAKAASIKLKSTLKELMSKRQFKQMALLIQQSKKLTSEAHVDMFSERMVKLYALQHLVYSLPDAKIEGCIVNVHIVM